MKAKAEPRREHTSKASARAVKQLARDRRLVLVVAGVAVAVLVYAVAAPTRWSGQVAMLCLLVAAVAGRALLGRREEEQSASDPWPWLRPLSLPLIVAAAILPYLPSLTIGFLSDDFGLNTGVQAHGLLSMLHAGRSAAFWRPLFMVGWWLQYRVGAGGPLTYHVVSLLLHAGNSVLVYLLARRLLQASWGALLAGLLFAVHPAHMEAIAWACCQADLEATLLSLLSLLCLDSYLRPRRRRWRWLSLAVALLSFLLALFAKEAVLALPGVAVLWAGLVEAGPRWRRMVVVGFSYGAVLAVYVGVRVLLIGHLGGYRLPKDIWNTAFPSAPLRMAALFFFPINQVWADATAPWLCWPLLIAAGAFLLWCMTRLDRIPAWRLGLAGGFLLFMAVPAWSLEPFMPDLQGTRYSYLPTIGLMWIVAEVMAAGAVRRRPYRLAGLLTAALLCVWWIGPWYIARGFTQKVLAAGKRMVESAPASSRTPTFFVQGLPDSKYGVYVFRNGFQSAVYCATARPAEVLVVGGEGTILPEVMAASSLRPDEYLYTWEAETETMKLLAAGPPGGTQ